MLRLVPEGVNSNRSTWAAPCIRDTTGRSVASPVYAVSQGQASGGIVVGTPVHIYAAG